MRTVASRTVLYPVRMRRELRAMLGLALPVILAELGWVMLGVVSAWTAVRHRRAELLRDFRRLASGDKRRTAFDALLPWAEGWRSDESSERRMLARQRAAHSGDGLSVRPASNASGDKQDHHASGRGVRL